MLRYLLGLAFVLSLNVASRADVVFSNLGSGDSFDPISSYWIAGSTVTVGNPPMVVGNFDVAAPFSIGSFQDSRFDSAELALSRSAGTNGLNVRLLADNAGSPGSELASVMIGGIHDIGSPSLVSADFHAAGITLQGSAQYWLVADSDGDVSILWHLNTTGDEGFAYRATDGWIVQSNPAGAFRISATVVPEPASTVFARALVAGVLGVIVRLR